MNELVEGVLSISPGLPPHDGSRGVVHPLPVPSDVFAVTLHVSLLEVGWESVQILEAREGNKKIQNKGAGKSEKTQQEQNRRTSTTPSCSGPIPAQKSRGN